jgi:hypothetical protein
MGENPLENNGTRISGPKFELSIFGKPALVVRRISWLIGVQETPLAYLATIDYQGNSVNVNRV